GIQARDAAMRDGGAYRHGVQHAGQHEIGGVARRAADLGGPVDARAGLADGVGMNKAGMIHDALPYCGGRAVDRAWTRQRRASSILKPFSLCATASSSAARAACR